MPKRSRTHLPGVDTPVIRTAKHSDEALLYGIVERLEHPNPSATTHLEVLTALVNDGPLLVIGGNTQAALAHFNRPDLNASLCAELRSFLRAAVRDQGKTSSARVSTAQPIEYRIVAGRLAAAGHLHDMAALQIGMLVDRVGLLRLRLCAEPGCGRLLVRLRKEKFCSKTCQRRNEVRRRLERERIEDEQHQAALARRKRLRAVRGA
jgi:hypothetical protein